MLQALFGSRLNAREQAPQRAKPSPWSSSEALNDSIRLGSQPYPSGGHSMSSGEIEFGSTPLGSTENFGPLSAGIMSGNVQHADSMPHHISGNVLSGELSHGGASVSGSYLGGALGVSRTTTPGGRNTTGVDAQMSVLGGAAQYEDDNVFGRFGGSAGIGFGGRVHTGSKYGVGADIGPFSGDIAFSPNVLSNLPDLSKHMDPFGGPIGGF